MSETKDILRDTYFVVVFDICSSTSIIDDLMLTGQIDKWVDYLDGIKTYLSWHRPQCPFIVYKFLGDGWILLFPKSVDMAEIVAFIRMFSDDFRRSFAVKMQSYLQKDYRFGLTFGMDCGELFSITMQNANRPDSSEFIGRALNVACRLQGELKHLDQSPEYKMLVSQFAFHPNRHAFASLETSPQKGKLRNVLGGEEVKCVKVDISPLPTPTTTTTVAANVTPPPTLSSFHPKSTLPHPPPERY